MRKAALIICSGALLVSGCGGKGSVRSAWQDVIRRCADSDLSGKKILFFGPSNAVGAGSVWRIDNAGTYRLRYDLNQMPQPQNFLGSYTPSTCDGTSSTKFKAGFDVSLGDTPLTAEAAAEIAKARTVSAKASAVSWVPVAEGPYETYVKTTAASTPVGLDLLTGTRLVLVRALKVSGFSTKITFDQSIGASVKAKIPAGTVIPSSIGGGLNVSWSESGELTLTSAGDFYIAGEFQPYKPGGFSAASATPFGPKLDVPAGITISRDDN